MNNRLHFLLILFVFSSSVVQLTEAGSSITRNGDFTSTIIGVTSTLSLKPGNNIGNGNSFSVAVSCSNGASVTGSPMNWGPGTPNTQYYYITATQITPAGVKVTCTYTYTQIGVNYNSLSNTVFTVGCQLSKFSSSNLGLQNQPGAGLACVNRVGLAAFYPFTNGVAAKDTSAPPTNPTVQGSITYTNDYYGNANSAGVFDGSSSMLISPFVVKNTAWALSFWFSTTDPKAGITCVVSSSSNDRCVELSSGFVTAFMQTSWLSWDSVSSPTSRGSPTYNDGTWHHVVYQYSSSSSKNQKLYVDGASVDTGGASSSYITSNTNVQFGYSADYGRYFSGKLDNIAMYNAYLSSSDITSLYTSSWLDQLMCFTCGTLTGYSTTTYYPSFQITPSVAGNTAATMSINGGNAITLTSDSASSSVPLKLGPNTISINTLEGTYQIIVTRQCDISSIAFTPSLTLTPASITCGTLLYSASVPFTTTTLAATITYQATDYTHKYVVDGATVTSNLGSGVVSGTANLKIYTNSVQIQGSVEGTYAFTVVRRCDITGLAFIPAMKLTPSYACDNANYNAAVGMFVTTLAVIANFTTGTHNYVLNTVPITTGLSNGVASDAGSLISPSNTITISQTDGPTITIILQRLTDAQNLYFSSSFGVVAMVPTFIIGTMSGYSITLPFGYQDIAATMDFGIGPAQLQVNGMVVDPSMTGNVQSMSGTLVRPTSFTAGRLNNVSVVNGIDGSYVVAVTVQPQDVRGFSLSCSNVFGAAGTIIPIPPAPGQTAINFAFHARYSACQLAVTYQSAGTVWINSPSEPYSGAAADSTTYSFHAMTFSVGMTIVMNVTSISDGVYTLSLTRSNWDVASLDLQTGSGPTSTWYPTPLTYTPSYVQTTPYYSASVKYLVSGVSVRAMCNGVVSAELIGTGGMFVNLMPTGFSAPFPLTLGVNLIRIISARDNGSPYPAIGYSSYNFTITRTASSLYGLAMQISPPASTPWTAYIQPAFSVDVFNYTVNVPISYTAAQFAPSFTGTNTISVSFSGGASFASIITSGAWTSSTTFLTGLASAGAANFFTFRSIEDGLYTITVNRPMDVQSIVAYSDAPSSSGVPFVISPTLLATYYTYTVTVPFKTTNIQLYVNYTATTTLHNQNAVSTPIFPNVNTVNIPTSYASPVNLTMSNANDGIYTIQILYQPPDVHGFALNTNLGALALSPPFTHNTYSYTAYAAGTLASIKLTTTYSTPSPQVNVTANGKFIGMAASLAALDVSSVLSQALYLTTGNIAITVYSPYDGPYTISIIPSCPQPYTVTPGTPATPLCQFFASYCTQPTSGYTRVCMLARPGCCGEPGCLC